MCSIYDDPSMHDEERPLKYGNIRDGEGRRFQLTDGLLDRDTYEVIAEKGEWGTLDHVDRGLYITYVINLDSGRQVRVEPMDVREEGDEPREG